MAEINNSQVFIDGDEVLQNATYEIEIAQGVGVHHQFTIIFPMSSISGYTATMMDASIDYIGKKISIYFENEIRKGKLEFVGIIDNISLHKSDSGTGDLKISGRSPDVLLANRFDCRSFEEDTSLSEVIDSIFGEFDSSILKTTKGSALGDNLPYTVQYNESDYHFLNRMSNLYGHWLYYNGTQLCVGLTETEEIKATYGVDINQFSIEASLREQAFTVNQHDWINNTPYQSFSASTNPKGKHSYLDTAKYSSDSLYTSEGYYNIVHGQPEYGKQEGLDKVAKALTLSKSVGMLIASGISELANLRIGDTLKVEGLNFEDVAQKDAYGSFSITEIIHRFRSSGEYTNTFKGVPKGTDYVSKYSIFSYPKAENQRAKVIDNADPEKLGRIKVQFPWQREGQTPWIKMITPYAGKEKGFYFTPEIGEEVMVGFEDGNAERPFILSAGYNKTANSTFANPDNNIKAIQTRSGHIIEFNDEEGSESLTITDNHGTTVVMSENNLSITAGNNISITAGNKLSFSANEIAIDSATKIETKAGTDISSDAGTKTSIRSGATNEMTAPETNIKGNLKLNLSSDANVSIDGKIKTDVKGGIVNLN